MSSYDGVRFVFFFSLFLSSVAVGVTSVYFRSFKYMVERREVESVKYFFFDVIFRMFASSSSEAEVHGWSAPWFFILLFSSVIHFCHCS